MYGAMGEVMFRGAAKTQRKRGVARGPWPCGLLPVHGVAGTAYAYTAGQAAQQLADVLPCKLLKYSLLPLMV